MIIKRHQVLRKRNDLTDTLTTATPRMLREYLITKTTKAREAKQEIFGAETNEDDDSCIDEKIFFGTAARLAPCLKPHPNMACIKTTFEETDLLEREETCLAAARVAASPKAVATITAIPCPLINLAKGVALPSRQGAVLHHQLHDFQPLFLLHCFQPFKWTRKPQVSAQLSILPEVHRPASDPRNGRVQNQVYPKTRPRNHPDNHPRFPPGNRRQNRRQNRR